LAALVALYQVAESFRSSLNAVTLIGGGLAYVFLFAMTATSFDRAQTWLGHRAWKILHTTGMHYIWLIFFNSYLPRALKTSPAYAPFVVLLLTGVGLRVAAWRRSRARRPSFEF
jgi:DMSO/TMAO reductase YedYZ heme-binding membrane subunit